MVQIERDRSCMMSEEENRPFKAEYAKSGRAGCKLCKGNIAQESLRLAKMVQVGVKGMESGRYLSALA